MKRKIFFNALDIRLVHERGFSELTLALRATGGQQVAFRRMPAQNLAGASHFEALGNGLFRLTTCN